jgi:prepilin-type N-terminal cleavage/methylation domain-containing protein
MIKARGGFTLVELMITMVIMVILTALAVVITGNIQVQARDNEREQDVQAIARGLEQYYVSGNQYYIPGGTKGTYPGSNMMISISGAGWCDNTFIPSSGEAGKFSKCSSEGYFSEVLPGVTNETLTPPGYESPQLITPWLPDDLEASITSALNENKYVLKPMFSDSTYCYDYDKCTRFELKYKKEATGEIITIKSRHQQ